MDEAAALRQSSPLAGLLSEDERRRVLVDATFGDDNRRETFLKAARQIRSNPLDFYGFRVNWYGTEQPMWEVTKNPPLGSFFIALAAEVAGWSELALHLAFLLPAVAAALGTLALARRAGVI